MISELIPFMYKTGVSLALLWCFASSAVAATGTIVDGPVAAQVLRVVDGDTLLVRAMPWPGHSVDVYVRLRRIDAPELRSRCATERQAARHARMKLEQMLENENQVHLSHISGDKYFGRVLANVRLMNGSDVADDLLTGGYARTYKGGRKNHRACF